MSKKLIYVVDDEIHIGELVKYNLEKNGYDVIVFENGESLLEYIKERIPHMILLDLMLPGIDGLDVCRILRSDEETKNIPVIMLTAKGEEFDKVLGLEIGADDYLSKPFSIRELIARIKAIFRRFTYVPLNQAEQDIITIKDISINLKRREVHKGNQQLQLTLKEFELLKILVINKGHVLTRELLLDKVWGYDYLGETRTIDVHIRHLRKMMCDDDEEYIETIRGIGYKMKD